MNHMNKKPFKNNIRDLPIAKKNQILEKLKKIGGFI